jgi:two-component system invasion response regulator UvrY
MIRIVLADDHTLMRDGLRQILAECPDMRVAGEASSGFEVMERLRDLDFDVLVLDMSMPGKNGIDLIRHVKSARPHLPVLILSMHKEEQYAVRTIKAGASGYLCKDSASLQLVQAIRKVAGGGKFVSPAAAEYLALALSEREALPHTRLSDREYQIFRQIAAGLGVTEIAADLNLSVKTVSTHKTRIMQKMRFTNLSELIRYAIRYELLETGSAVD